MGFFKTVTLRRHAERIAAGFSILRTQQFDSVLRGIQKRIEPQAVSGRETLGGDADSAFKAYQLLIFSTFSIEHPYVSAEDFREFAGRLSIAVYGTDQQQVEAYLLKFGEYQRKFLRESTDERKITEDAYAELLTGIAIPIADYIVPESNAIAWTITAMLMPLFTINTQMVIADEFRDGKTLKTLQLQMDNVRRELTVKNPQVG